MGIIKELLQIGIYVLILLKHKMMIKQTKEYFEAKDKKPSSFKKLEKKLKENRRAFAERVLAGDSAYYGEIPKGYA